ncbi:uncharacterized protein PGTG_09125 [Puccinia graminis f. sp. tritici CRL 75-36-700-3]|uniref:Tyr recombinase domain-containing protein n=1 Tax=Puccinia graminis f. sp. tritici (strain CRL 75-36-700-3 / race SCCL) TaxID=418459 RepID=E3KG76_PUCGT|nr:uncharacterized protein PGTG_09125 [Puccinia graminis f. sp. tritici CRL 75-36-700-3]EFP83172.2 hypothetical protein PGTG_09125 [Puccinia graminis f. sp. tritici CRL 75-36-700-3]
MSNPNSIQSLSDRVKDSSQQANLSQSPSQQASQIPLPNSSTPKSLTQPLSKENRPTGNLNPAPKGKETTSTKTGEPDPALQSSVTRSTLKNPIEIIDGSNETPSQSKSTNARAKEILLAKAVKAQEDGDDAKADRFFAMFDTLSKESPQPSNEKTTPTTAQATPDSSLNNKKRPIESEGTTQVRGIKFIWANTNSHDDGGFTPYFHKNLLELKGPIPLTIFNKTWQEEALSHHSKNRPKSDESSAEKNLRYHGLAVPDEWLQSFSDWTLNHQCFYETIRDRYNYPVLAEWILLHKANCDRLQKKHGFMVALRYDIRIRNNAFAFRVEKDGEESFSNISLFKPETADDAHSESRNFNELGVRDNPYALGGPRYGWDPHTGQKRTKTTASTTPNNNTNGSKAPLAGSSQSLSQAPANSLPPRPDQNRPPRTSGYKGRNYNPNHGSATRRRGNEKVRAHTEPQSLPLASNKPHRLEPAKEGTPDWPEAIRCEMDVEEWERSLEKAGLAQEFSDVIRGFKEGFDQGIPNHNLGPATPYFTPPNHQSALLAQDKIEQSMRKEVEAGRMFGPYTHEQLMKKFSFFRTNPLGAAVNGDGSIRPINDLSFPRNNPLTPSVNSFVDKLDYATTWDDFENVSKFFKRQTGPLLLALFDWEKAYRQIPTAKSQWAYLMVRDFNGGILIDTRIAFGGVAGCGSFGRPADAWKQLMLHEFDLVTVFRWVDDNLFVKHPDSKVEMDHIVARSESLGVKTNSTKYSPFKEEQKYIGFIWNATRKSVRLPDDKKYQRVQQIKEFLQIGSEFSFKQVEVMAGRLNHVSYLLPQLRCYLNSLYRWMNTWVHRSKDLPLPPGARVDLQEWLTTLLSFKETRMIRDPDPIEIGWMGDASTSYGIGITIGRRWAQFQLTKDWDKGPEPKRDIAWLETVAIRLGLIALAQLSVKRGKTIIVWTDNTTTESAILKRKSKHQAVNDEWKIIQRLLIEMELDIVSRRVSSGDNVADALSRGNREGRDPQLQIPITVPSDLEHRMFQSVSAITSNGSEPREPTAQERHYLLGYRWNTLLSYNAAIKKYQSFARDTGKPTFRLPLTAQDIFDFCCWAGRTAESSTTHEISANTLSKYLAGLQMWHVYHNAVYPADSKTKVATFLKSSAYIDAETDKKPKKKPVTIENLVKLTELLIDGDPFQKALLDLSVVAFWGMARLAELTYNEGSGPLRKTASLLTTDVELVYKERENLAKLTIRGAKTADPGQSQTIYLKELPHMLCPVLAVKRRLAEAGGAETSLFGYTDHHGERFHLTKPQSTRALSKIWGACGFEGVSGHSFRVGGASIQVALGVPISEIRIRGRWASDAYKLYLRDFTEEEMRKTNKLLARLEECWMHVPNPLV